MYANLDLIHEWQKLRAALSPEMFRHLRDTHNLRDHGFFNPTKEYDLQSFCERILLMMFFWTFSFGEPPYWHAAFYAALGPRLSSAMLLRHSVRVAQEAHALRKRGYTVADAMREAQAASESPNAFATRMRWADPAAEASPIDALGFSPDEGPGPGGPARFDPVRAAIKRMARQAEAQRNEQRSLGRLLDALAAHAKPGALHDPADGAETE